MHPAGPIPRLVISEIVGHSPDFLTIPAKELTLGFVRAGVV
jgi:hypothetical protein